MKFWRASFEICDRTDGHTYRHADRYSSQCVPGASDKWSSLGRESVGRSDERVRRAGPSMTHVPHQGAATTTTTTTTEKLMRGELSAERHAAAVASFVLFSGDSASASLDASASRAGGPYNASRSYCIPPPMAASVGNNGNLPPSFLSKLLIPLQLTNICGKTSRNALCKWKADAKSQNLCSKLEPEVVYSRRLLDSEREKSRKRIL